MTKSSTSKYKKIFNDISSIYSYILTSSEIKKLSNEINKLIHCRSGSKIIEISERDILLITYADTLIEKKKKVF